MRPVLFTRFTTLRDKLTAGQRAFARVAYDELEPGQLDGEERERASTIWGPIHRIPAAARRVLVQAKGRDVGGTRLAAERCAHLGATLALDRIGHGELAYVPFVGPKLRHARVGLRFARAVLLRQGARLEEDSRDGFTLVRHDCRRVRFEAFAASRGGDTVRGVPIIAALLDEAAFFFDEATGVVNAEHIFGAIIPRLLRGGQILVVSSVWAESGLLYTLFQANWGHPITAMAALCPTLVMRDDAETITTVAAERARDPDNARQEFDAEFLGGGAGIFFPTPAVGAAFVGDMYPLAEAPTGAAAGIGADIGLVSDSSAICAVYAVAAGFRVGEIVELRPRKGSPLKLSEVVREFCAFALRHGSRRILADHHVLEPAREHLVDDVHLDAAPAGQTGKVTLYVDAKKALTEGRVQIPGQYRRLGEQLGNVVARPTAAGGMSISSPRRGGSHGDQVSAFVNALTEAAGGVETEADREALRKHMSQLAYETMRDPERAGASRWLNMPENVRPF